MYLFAPQCEPREKIRSDFRQYQNH